MRRLRDVQTHELWTVVGRCIRRYVPLFSCSVYYVFRRFFSTKTRFLRFFSLSNVFFLHFPVLLFPTIVLFGPTFSGPASSSIHSLRPRVRVLVVSVCQECSV